MGGISKVGESEAWGRQRLPSDTDVIFQGLRFATISLKSAASARAASLRSGT
jgi:hypothetical protein